MRGKLRHLLLTWNIHRNIPAYAGKTVVRRLGRGAAEEHPRVCGENTASSNPCRSNMETSPRMRGKPFQVPVVVAHVGNILAYAGKTRWHCACSRSSSEHPRVCGENAARAASVKPLVGTSPHTRGKRCGCGSDCGSNGNIPAYAGKTSRARPL